MYFITGSNGFVGSKLCLELNKRNMPFKAGVRAASGPNEISYGDISEQKNWVEILSSISVVVHLAARVHVMSEVSSDPHGEFLKYNRDTTYSLAKAAKERGVKKFIFISSIKVNGEITFEHPFRASDTPAPEDSYGISKAEAEKMIMELHEEGVFEVVIIRPPLIYGPGVKANFASLLSLVKKSIPLPFGMADQNKRSMVSVFNVVDLIIVCAENPKAGGKVFLVSDDNDLSLKELLLKMGAVTHKNVSLFPVPLFIFKIVTSILGKKSYYDRLFGNLQVDIADTKSTLDWKPKKTFEESF